METVCRDYRCSRLPRASQVHEFLSRASSRVTLRRQSCRRHLQPRCSLTQQLPMLLDCDLRCLFFNSTNEVSRFFLPVPAHFCGVAPSIDQRGGSLTFRRPSLERPTHIYLVAPSRLLLANRVKPRRRRAVRTGGRGWFPVDATLRAIGCLFPAVL